MSYTFREKPQTTIPSTIELPAIAHHTLSGGDQLHLLTTNTTSLIQLELKYKAGSWHQEIPFQALITSKMLSEGTSSYNAKSIAETIDFYGGYYALSVDKDVSTIQFVFPKIYLDKILPIISEMLFKSVIPEKELQIITENIAHQIKMDDQRGDVIANKKLFALIFGDKHPYGRSGSPEEVKFLTQENVLNFYKSHYQEQCFDIFVVGDITQSDIAIIDTYLSPKRTINPIALKSHSLDINIPSKIVIHREQSTQASIRIGKMMFNQHHLDYMPLHFASTVLGGYFGSRLMSNLREDKGYTYGIGSYLISYLHSGFFGISTEVSLEHTDAAIAEIERELSILHNTYIDEEELLRVKNYLIGNYLKSFDGAFNLMGQYTSILTKGLPLSYPQDYLDAVSKTTATDVKNMINKYLQQETLTTVVVKNTNNKTR